MAKQGHLRRFGAGRPSSKREAELRHIWNLIDKTGVFRQVGKIKSLKERTKYLNKYSPGTYIITVTEGAR